MPFMHKTAPFGAYTLHTLEDAQGDNYLAFVPGFGSCVLELRLGGVSLLDGYKTAVEMEANRWAKNTVLFPFPNRLSDGAYSWDGNSYQFPINEPISGTALHGFGQDKPMQAYQFSVREAEATAECRYSDPGEQDYYPFPFRFFIHFTLRPGALDIAMRFCNDGTTDLPVGLGWHPYFTLASRIDDMSMQMPDTDLVGVDERMIPTGKKYPLPRVRQLAPHRCHGIRQLLRTARGRGPYGDTTGRTKRKNALLAGNRARQMQLGAGVHPARPTGHSHRTHDL